MKNLIFLFLCFSLHFANAQEKGKLNFTSTTFDFGKIAYKSEGKATFKFKNTGVSPVTIDRVSSTCGCTVPEQPKQAIQPGESSELDVIYDTTRVGPIRKTITVYSDASNPTITLKIIGQVLPKP